MGTSWFTFFTLFFFFKLKCKLKILTLRAASFEKNFFKSHFLIVFPARIRWGFWQALLVSKTNFVIILIFKIWWLKIIPVEKE